MKKKIKFLVNIGLVLFMLSFVRCKSDNEFLKENPKSFYTVDNVFSTSAQIDQTLITIYSQIRRLIAGDYIQNWLNWKGNGTDTQGVCQLRMANTFADYSLVNPNHATFYQTYSLWYSIIQEANLVLYASELPGISWASNAEKTYMVAQARFFRAYAYLNLGELFGGVPIVTEIISTPRYDFVRATRVETYKYAIDELIAIEKDLPETTAIGGRIVRGAAQHFLCELYLAMGTQMAADGKSAEAQNAFVSSITYGNKVINGGTYSLINARFGTRKSEQEIVIPVFDNGILNNPKSDTLKLTTNYYWDMFQEGNQNYQEGNSECIWAVQIDYAAYKTTDNGTGSTNGALLPYTAFRDCSHGHLKGILEDQGGRGVMLVMPTGYTRDLIYSDKWNSDMRNSEICFRRRFKGNVPGDPFYGKIIPWNELYNGRSVESENIRNRSYQWPISCKIATDKFTGLADGQNRSNLFRDEYVARLAETILLRAEAKQRSGDKVGAASDINLLRSRAKCSYLVTAADMDDKFDMILDERARELVYEEHRWNTLLRMGGTIAVDRIRKYAYWPETLATLTFNYNLWPIPQSVIDTNKDKKLEQNPGWVR
jgi:hypothetical protein